MELDGRDSRFPTAARFLIACLGLAIVIRCILYIAITRAGYYYGIPWDTFSRTGLAYQWSQVPFFGPADAYWLPLQFWIVGLGYWFVHPWVETSSLLVPVVVNNVFFACSLIVAFHLSFRLSGRVAAGLCVVLLAAFSGDIWVTYSGLSEPALITFIMLSCYLFGELVEKGKPAGWKAVSLGMVGLFASATHYIGWFLAALCAGFLGIRAWQAFEGGQREEGGFSLAGVFLCLLFPIAWFLWNDRIWGSPLHFMTIAQGLQAGYAGALPLIKRLAVVPASLVIEFPMLAVTGLASSLLTCRRDFRKCRMLIPPIFIMLCIWISTLLGYSAPYQEPRYLLFFVWALTPFTATALAQALKSGSRTWRMLAVMITITILVGSSLRVFQFQNSFGADVRVVADLAGQWLGKRNDESIAIVEATSFAETGVIPVSSGYPQRFRIIEANQFDWEHDHLSESLNEFGPLWLAIAKSSQLADGALRQGLPLLRVGDYYMTASDGSILGQ